MASTSKAPLRRKPQQARAELRRARFLQVAAELIGERGYEAVGMTAIAEHAHASIGTLYDYFPDKQSIALRLLAELAEKGDAHWAEVLQSQETVSKEAFAGVFVEGVVAFVNAHPAYLPLMGASIGYARTAEERLPLRRTIADALQRTRPDLDAARAFLGAQVLVELAKGMLAVYRQVAVADRPIIVRDFKTLMLQFVTHLSSDRQAKVK